MGNTVIRSPEGDENEARYWFLQMRKPVEAEQPEEPEQPVVSEKPTEPALAE